MVDSVETNAGAHAPHLAGYALWGLVGAFIGLGFFGLWTIGLFFLLAAVILTVICLVIPRFRNRSAVAIVAGLGLPFLFIAWLNRGGPGWVCSTTDTTEHCFEAWNPWIFLGVGLALIAGGVVLAWLGRRRPRVTS